MRNKNPFWMKLDWRGARPLTLDSKRGEKDSYKLSYEDILEMAKAF